MADVSDDALEAITTALARLRGGPGGPFGHGGHGAAGSADARGGPHGGPWGGGHGGHRHHRGEHGGDGAAWEARAAGFARFRVLDALIRATAPLSVSELAERIGVDQPRASRLVQQGVDHGFLRREADPADARRTLIVLTDDGRTVIERFRGQRRQQLTEALSALTPAEQAELARLLTRVAEHWPR